MTVSLFGAAAQDRAAAAGQSSEAALAVYADAANYQNNGAFDLAITEWQKFLERHSDDPLAGKAAHYLGVCQMQKDPPDVEAAAESFAKALQKKDDELREETLANRGWCLYSLANSRDGDSRQQALRAALETYAQLLRDFPQAQLLDQALFYSGEAATALEQYENAAEFYSKLLKSAEQSTLRCQSIYALGFAREQLEQLDQALSAYQQLLRDCGDSPLATEARIRIADVLIKQTKFAEAEPFLRKAIEAGGPLTDYALYRCAYCLVKQEKLAEAALLYERLSKQFAESPYAAAARLASAQASYRAKDYAAAATGFRQVLTDGQPDARIEAAHWLCQMLQTEGKVAESADLAERALQIEAPKAAYRRALELDLADAWAAIPDRAVEAIDRYRAIARADRQDPLAPRALYGAGFTALQVGKNELAEELAASFIKEFADDPLLPDVGYVAAEAALRRGDHAAAAKAYERLITSAPEHPSRGMWWIRWATARYQNDDFAAILKQLPRQLPQFKNPSQQAEAQLLIGSSYLQTEQYAEAAESLAAALKADNKHPRREETQLLLGQAQLKSGDRDAAAKTWEQLIAAGKSSSTDQARLRLAQLRALEGDGASALKLYDQLLRGEPASAVRGYALLGRANLLLQDQQYVPALESLENLLAIEPVHPMALDGQLARGICLRRLGRAADADQEFQKLLDQDLPPEMLGTALHEAALADSDQKQPAEAAAKLERLLNSVPDYAEADKVRYELAWALQDVDSPEKAARQFAELARQHPDSPLAAEAFYHIGQYEYDRQDWSAAAEAYGKARKSNDPDLVEKALYRLGWSNFQANQLDAARQAFNELLDRHRNGGLARDAQLMLAECQFKAGDYPAALTAFTTVRESLKQPPKDAPADATQPDQLVLLHGGQAAMQLDRFDDALGWFEQLRKWYPATPYLAQAFYEAGVCKLRLDRPEEAMPLLAEVAENYRNETAARARFMMGELFFNAKDPAKAIAEFQRVMFGFGGDKAPPEIRDWQAKSGFEAGRCSELLLQRAEPAKKAAAREVATKMYRYVVDNHPEHDLAAKAKTRLETLERS